MCSLQLQQPAASTAYPVKSELGPSGVQQCNQVCSSVPRALRLDRTLLSCPHAYMIELQHPLHPGGQVRA